MGLSPFLTYGSYGILEIASVESHSDKHAIEGHLLFCLYFALQGALLIFCLLPFVVTIVRGREK